MGLGGEAFGTVPVSANSGSGDGMFEHQLLQGRGFQNDRVLVERAHPAGELYAVEKVHGNVLVPLQSRVEERFLNVAH